MTEPYMSYGIKEKTGFTLIAVTVMAALVVAMRLDPVAQNPGYHLFADTRTIWRIPNFLDVVSNLPFLIVGLMGLYRMQYAHRLQIDEEMKTSYLLLFSGVGLIAIGSAYYHLSPSNDTLVWDRLPMSIAFMAIFAIILGEFISLRLGKILLLPLSLAGVASVVYWYATETAGQGDLRFYGLIQYLPMVLIPIILIFFRSRFSHSAAYWWLLLAYLIAKVFEHFDAKIYNASTILSGHTLKHLAAAAGLYILVLSYQKRDITNQG